MAAHEVRDVPVARREEVALEAQPAPREHVKDPGRSGARARHEVDDERIGLVVQLEPNPGPPVSSLERALPDRTGAPERLDCLSSQIPHQGSLRGSGRGARRSLGRASRAEDRRDEQ